MLEEVNLCYQAACEDDIDGVKKQVQRLLHNSRSTSEQNKPSSRWLFASLLIAIEKHNLELVQFLLNERVVDEDLPFESAVRARAFEILEFFLGLGWDINTPIYASYVEFSSIPICTSDRQMTEWLLDHGADPNSRCDWDLTPISQAIYAAPLELIDYLFSRGANPRCGQLLHHAVLRDKSDALQVVRQVAELGAPINEIKYETDPRGYSEREPFSLGTPLHRAAEFRKVGIIKYLLEMGADPQKLDSKRQTPRFWAETYGHTEMALILKEAEERQIHGTDIRY
ncbi:ankyrin [Lentithecium fluviatile CBS 122367]|uniref:Ankyrin n=1 Tax=Lentithecium fluviatile CBS 122367 TaxID=1168545 RepID=A0A6G1JC93_9PLEO|nr:ankyrin [Lentithecium fluviatile CBS 122367]